MLLKSNYGSDMTFKGRTFRVVQTSRASQLQMGPTNQTLMRPAVFDMPVNTTPLADGTTAEGFDVSGIGLKSFVESGGSRYEVMSITDDPQEPFVRLTCVRKQ